MVHGFFRERPKCYSFSLGLWYLTGSKDSEGPLLTGMYWWKLSLSLFVLTGGSGFPFLVFPQMAAHSLGFTLPLLIWVPAPTKQSSSMSQQPCLHSCPFSMLYINPGSKLSTVPDCHKTKKKKEKENSPPKSMYSLEILLKICSDVGCLQDSTANTVYFNIRSLFLLDGFFGHSVSKSQVRLHDSPLSSQSPWSLIA